MDNRKSSVNMAAMFFCEEFTEACINGDSKAVKDAEKMLADHIKILDDDELTELAAYSANKIEGYAKIFAMIISEWEKRFKT